LAEPQLLVDSGRPAMGDQRVQLIVGTDSDQAISISIRARLVDR